MTSGRMTTEQIEGFAAPLADWLVHGDQFKSVVDIALLEASFLKGEKVLWDGAVTLRSPRARPAYLVVTPMRVVWQTGKGEDRRRGWIQTSLIAGVSLQSSASAKPTEQEGYDGWTIWDLTLDLVGARRDTFSGGGPTMDALAAALEVAREATAAQRLFSEVYDVARKPRQVHAPEHASADEDASVDELNNMIVEVTAALDAMSEALAESSSALQAEIDASEAMTREMEEFTHALDAAPGAANVGASNEWASPAWYCRSCQRRNPMSDLGCECGMTRPMVPRVRY